MKTVLLNQLFLPKKSKPTEFLNLKMQNSLKKFQASLKN